MYDQVTGLDIDNKLLCQSTPVRRAFSSTEQQPSINQLINVEPLRTSPPSDNHHFVIELHANLAPITQSQYMVTEILGLFFLLVMMCFSNLFGSFWGQG